MPFMAILKDWQNIPPQVWDRGLTLPGKTCRGGLVWHRQGLPQSDPLAGPDKE